ncbi:hypothetical protein L7F22_050205 [Adiantum nelumboides]|nr:hypothetical protein [Adiantum nelumboides]
MDNRVQDFMKVSFDIDADFTSLFNWNTKQVFLSLVAEYPTKRHELNQVVLWDRIVRSKKDANVYLLDATNKYPFREVSKNFANVNGSTFTLKWNTMPKVGILAYGDEQRTNEYSIPARLQRDGIAELYF